MRSLPPLARVSIVAVCAAGVASVVLHGPGTLEWSTANTICALLLAVATMASERFPIQFAYRTERVTQSLSEGIWVAALLLEPASVVILGAGAGVLLGQALESRAPVKVAFNVAQSVVGLTAATAVFAASGSPPVTEPRAWLAAAAGLAAYALVNTFIVSAIVALTEGVSVWKAQLPTGVPHSLAKLAIGILGALLWVVEPAALPLLLLPVAMTYFAYRSWLRTIQERDWMDEMGRNAADISYSGDLSKRIDEPDDHAAVGNLARTLNHMLDRVESAFQRERLFIRETSHELRTPITICRGYLEVLGPDPSPVELKDTVAVVVDELDRMARIVEDMSTLARMEDPGSLRMQTVELERFVSDVATKASGLLDGRLRVHPPTVRRPLRVDSQRMTQALINLLKNAEDHTSDGGPIDFRVTDEAGAWRFEVSDQGGGLPPGEEQRVFRPFHTGTRSSGSGLGLAIVYGIARAHGGSAGVENRPGAGATFWVRVPQ